jgi:hypothetical protein
MSFWDTVRKPKRISVCNVSEMILRLKNNRLDSVGRRGKTSQELSNLKSRSKNLTLNLTLKCQEVQIWSVAPSLLLHGCNGFKISCTWVVPLMSLSVIDPFDRSFLSLAALWAAQYDWKLWAALCNVDIKLVRNFAAECFLHFENKNSIEWWSASFWDRSRGWEQF